MISKDDVVLDQLPAFTISWLRRFLQDQEVKIGEEEEEELIGDDTGVLKVLKVDDDGKDRIVVAYGCSYEV